MGTVLDKVVHLQVVRLASPEVRLQEVIILVTGVLHMEIAMVIVGA